MPTYFNPNTDAVHSRNVVIPPRATVATESVLDLTTASITGREIENFSIIENRNDKLYLMFNDDQNWTEITLTANPGSPGSTAQDIADDINNNSVMVAKGYSGFSPESLATDDGGYLKLEAPPYQPFPAPGSPAPSPWTEPARTSRIYVRPSPAAVMLGLPVSVQSPVKQAYPTLIKIDDSPIYNPILATSGSLSSVATYTLTEIDRASFVKLFVVSGDATFKINDITATNIILTSTMPPIHLPADGRITEIHVTSGALVIEEWMNPAGLKL